MSIALPKPPAGLPRRSLAKAGGRSHSLLLFATHRAVATGAATAATVLLKSLYFFHRPFCDGDGTNGSEGPKFSAAHFRANCLSSAALCKVNLCLIFSQWVSMVFRLR
jgi:hypothetical protein